MTDGHRQKQTRQKQTDEQTLGDWKKVTVRKLMMEGGTDGGCVWKMTRQREKKRERARTKDADRQIDWQRQTEIVILYFTKIKGERPTAGSFFLLDSLNYVPFALSIETINIVKKQCFDELSWCRCRFLILPKEYLKHDGILTLETKEILFCLNNIWNWLENSHELEVEVDDT